MATNSREARRRKIMERGSDRLALITGRIQTLPSSSSSSTDPATHREDTDPPSHPLISHDQEPQIHVPDQIPVVTPEIEEKGFDLQCDTNTEEVFGATDSQTQPLVSSSSTVERPSPSSLPTLTPFQKPRLVTWTGISDAIEATERTRIYISVAVAFLVVLAHLSFPLLGSKMVKTLLGFRPLYLVLVTNVTLVLVRIVESGRRRLSGMAGRLGELNMPVDGYEWADRLGRTLQAGLVVKKVLDALLMDCAVYAIIVVCGLSFAQQLS
ncbi:unnamed protein product [Prunus armeniaca]|uniref:Uncharacterized protein n=1 Tax=Prunus armeniaca TaxID=36596 RepID=A0A6J5WCI9_PRUAR|nr:unnamed protein product [Prunus armeniaca]CAB4297094.1 unnamed protein product [Prunus armeniaca]